MYGGADVGTLHVTNEDEGVTVAIGNPVGSATVNRFFLP